MNDIQIEGEIFHREALTNLKGGFIRDRKRLELEKREMTETLLYRGNNVNKQVEEKNNEFNKLQESVENLSWENQIEYELKIR